MPTPHPHQEDSEPLRLVGHGAHAWERAGLFLSQTSTSGELASVLLLERPSANALQQQVGGHLPWDGTQRFYMKDFNYLSLPRVGVSFALGRRKKTHPSSLSPDPGGAVFQGSTLVSFTSDPRCLLRIS